MHNFSFFVSEFSFSSTKSNYVYGKCIRRKIVRNKSRLSIRGFYSCLTHTTLVIIRFVILDELNAIFKQSEMINRMKSLSLSHEPTKISLPHFFLTIYYSHLIQRQNKHRFNTSKHTKADEHKAIVFQPLFPFYCLTPLKHILHTYLRFQSITSLKTKTHIKTSFI